MEKKCKEVRSMIAEAMGSKYVKTVERNPALEKAEARVGRVVIELLANAIEVQGAKVAVDNAEAVDDLAYQLIRSFRTNSGKIRAALELPAKQIAKKLQGPTAE